MIYGYIIQVVGDDAAAWLMATRCHRVRRPDWLAGWLAAQGGHVQRGRVRGRPLRRHHAGGGRRRGRGVAHRHRANGPPQDDAAGQRERRRGRQHPAGATRACRSR